MIQMGFTNEELDDVPFGIAIPIREALRVCQMNPPSSWPVSAYTLLGRKDLAKMAVMDEVVPLPVKVCDGS
jgi:anaphase-promoting complex subunit 1